MSSSLNGLTLGNVVSLQRGNTYKSAMLGLPGPVLLGLGTIQRDGGFRGDSLKTYGGESAEKLLLRPGELYVSLKDVTQSGDLLGSVARVPNAVAVGRLTQDTVKLVTERDDYPQALLYWTLRSPEYRSYCRARGTGTTNLALSREDFLSFSLPEPTSTRMTLVEIFEGIEKRIDLLRETNATLEAIAQALFKSWFIDFAPVRAKQEGRAPEGVDEATAALFPEGFEETELGMVPRGWCTGTLGEIAQAARRQIQANELHGSLHYVGLEHIPRKSLSLMDWGVAEGLESAKSSFRVGDILFGKLRPYFHKVVVAPMDGVCSTDILVCNAIQPCFYGFVAMQLFSEALVAYADRLSNGAKMPRVSWKDLAAYELVVPADEVAEAYTATIQPLIDRMRANVFEVQTLANLCDTLLPRLISGQLRLPEAEALVA